MKQRCRKSRVWQFTRAVFVDMSQLSEAKYYFAPFKPDGPAALQAVDLEFSDSWQTVP